MSTKKSNPFEDFTPVEGFSGEITPNEAFEEAGDLKALLGADTTEGDPKPGKPSGGTGNPGGATKKKTSAEVDDEEEEEEDDDIVIDPNEVEEEEEEDDEEGDEASPFMALAKHLEEAGVIELGETTSLDTEEELSELFEKNIQTKVEDYKAKTLRNPLARDLFEFLEANPDADINSFVQAYSEPDYSKIDLDELEDNDQMQKALVRNLLIVEGYSQEEIEEELEDFESSGIMLNKAKRAIGKLQKYSETRKQQIKQAEVEKVRENKEKYNTWLAETKKEIESLPDIGGFVLNKTQKEKFYEYLTKVDKNGQTPYMADVAKDEKKRYLMAWYYFNDFKFDTLKKEVKKEVTKSLKDKLNSDDFRSKKSDKKTSTSASKVDFKLLRNI